MTDTMASADSTENPNSPEMPSAEIDGAQNMPPKTPAVSDEKTTDTPAAKTSTPAALNAPASESDIPTVPDENKPTGTEAEIRKIADDYVIPFSDEGISEWVKALKGKDVSAFRDYAEQVATGLYPTFAPQILMGIPTRILLDPYIQVAQQVLGPIMSEPNWSDPKWSKALQGGIDPKTNRPIPMQLDEWRKFLMTEPGHGWSTTPMAHERVNAFAQELNKQFGGNEMPGDVQ